MKYEEPISFKVTDVDGEDNYEFTFYVLPSFEKDFPDYKTKYFLQLMLDCKLPTYFHNPYGRIVEINLNGKKLSDEDMVAMGYSDEGAYGLNGRMANSEQIKEIKKHETK